MKKVLAALVTIFSLVTIKTNAQLERGNVLVGSDIARFDVGLRKNSGFDIELQPKAAWFINNNFAIGAQVGLGVSKFNKESPTLTTYNIGPIARYYVNRPDINLLKHGRFFGEANVGIQGTNVSDGGGSTNGLGLGVGPGYAYFITPTIGLETLLKVNSVVGFGDVTSQTNLSLTFGLQIYLPARSTLNKVKSQEGM